MSEVYQNIQITTKLPSLRGLSNTKELSLHFSEELYNVPNNIVLSSYSYYLIFGLYTTQVVRLRSQSLKTFNVFYTRAISTNTVIMPD